MVSEPNQYANDHSESEGRELLKIALNETQQSIRSYDTKAQICAIGYLFSLNLVLGINAQLFPDGAADLWVVLFGWGILIFPMFLFGLVLYPTRRSVKVNNDHEQNSIFKVLYIRHERHKSVDDISADALKANTLRELAFELYQSSDLRDRKRSRFVRALVFSGLALLITFIVHFGTAIIRIII